MKAMKNIIVASVVLLMAAPILAAGKPKPKTSTGNETLTIKEREKFEKNKLEQGKTTKTAAERTQESTAIKNNEKLVRDANIVFGGKNAAKDKADFLVFLDNKPKMKELVRLAGEKTQAKQMNHGGRVMLYMIKFVAKLRQSSDSLDTLMEFMAQEGENILNGKFEEGQKSLVSFMKALKNEFVIAQNSNNGKELSYDQVETIMARVVSEQLGGISLREFKEACAKGAKA
ncbi:MAG: hypothetical protein HOO06_14170 [Bdellovibrionaceae bacterium]|jgi:hypothetical protein|nr:hypothetical protein [Pseudobdellovibrionaceae bacterium]